MRVTFEHHEKATSKGTFSSKTVRQVEVVTNVQFLEAELAIIKGWRFEFSLVLERKYDALTRSKSEEKDKHPDRVTVASFLQKEPDRFTFDTPGAAKDYQHELTEQLKLLKLCIEANSALGETTIFEL